MDKFDKYLNEKLNNAEVPFNEEHWKEFSRHLTRANRIKKWQHWSIAAAVIIATVSTLYFVLQNNSEQNNSENHISTEIVITNTGNETVNAASGDKNVEITPNKPAAPNTVKKTPATNTTPKQPVSSNDITQAQTASSTTGNNNHKKVGENTNTPLSGHQETAPSNIENHPAATNNTSIDISSLSIDVSTYSTCAGTAIQVKLNNPQQIPLNEITWNFGDGHTAKGELSTYVYKFSGEYQILCNVNNNFDKPVTIAASKKVTVHRLPEAEISYQNMWEQHDNNKLYYPYTTLTAKPVNVDIVAYHWSLGNGISTNGESVTTIYDEPKSYQAKLLITDNYGCSNTLTIEIPNNEPFDILAPNAFTPNNDGNNDTFYPKAIKEFQVPATIIIKDLSGKTVFEGTQENCEWNGTFMNTGNPLPTGVYVYTVITTDVQGKQHQFAGKVNLLR